MSPDWSLCYWTTTNKNLLTLCWFKQLVSFIRIGHPDGWSNPIFITPTKIGLPKITIFCRNNLHGSGNDCTFAAKLEILILFILNKHCVGKRGVCFFVFPSMRKKRRTWYLMYFYLVFSWKCLPLQPYKSETVRYNQHAAPATEPSSITLMLITHINWKPTRVYLIIHINLLSFNYLLLY